MRTVTITRQKSFVGCAGNLKIYIDDPAGDLTINGTACRMLGLLGNGKTEVFYVDENAHRLFFIFDKISRNYCNEFTDIAAGPDNIELTGKNHYNPAAGNPFRLDGLASAEVVENRRRGTRKGVIIFIVAILIGLAIGFATAILPTIQAGQPEVFTSAGLSITLNKAFDADADANFDFYYISREMDIMGERVPYSADLATAEDSLDEICAVVIEQFEETGTPAHEGGLTYFEYEIDDLRFLAVVYKDMDAFWIVQFCAYTEDFEDLRPTMIEYAQSVTFE